MPPGTLASSLADPTSRLLDVSSHSAPGRLRQGRPDSSRLVSSHTGIAPSDEYLYLLPRIRGEFREMPGLHLTLGQAARLFDLQEEACRAALGTLTDEGFLARTPAGTFHRNDTSP
jgi:hypothetical protein